MKSKTIKNEQVKGGSFKVLSLADKETRIDMPLLIITLTLLGFGLVMLFSASYVVGVYRFQDGYHYIKDQLLYAFIGVVGMLAFSKINYRDYKKWAVPLYIVTIGLLIIVLFMEPIKGVTRWISVPGIGGSFQPSEIAKFALILMFATMIENIGSDMKKISHGIIPFVFLLVIYIGLFFLEPHLSASVILLSVAGIMMIVGGSDIKIFIFAAIAIVLAAIILLIAYPEIAIYAKPRIDAWFNPESDLQGSGYQTYQSILAIGSGGLFGLGLGNSRQKHLHLPEPQNDFIFSVICEELGFVGGMIVIMLFLALLLRGMYIAVKAKDKFGGMLVVGIISQITMQAFFNIGVATGTLPNTGISLPFFSEGGTSLIMLLLQISIVLSVSRYADLD